MYKINLYKNLWLYHYSITYIYNNRMNKGINIKANQRYCLTNNKILPRFVRIRKLKGFNRSLSFIDCQVLWWVCPLDRYLLQAPPAPLPRLPPLPMVMLPSFCYTYPFEQVLCAVYISLCSRCWPFISTY